MKNKFSLFLVCIMLVFSSTALFVNADTTKIKNDNNPPNPPEITGPTSGNIDEYYTYTITVSDPDYDDKLLRLEVDFGDGTVTEDCGCDRIWENPTTLEISHKWKKTGNYQTTGRVMDVSGIWSEWSDPLAVSMPKEKTNFNLLFQKIFLFLPNIYKIKQNTWS